MGVRMSELSKRSKKEFFEKYMPLEVGQEYLEEMASWFDSGEESLTLKEIEKIDRWFYNSNYIYSEFKDMGVIKYSKLLSSVEGKELIKKILKEAEEK